MSGEKRSQNWEDSVHAETVIIVDIEGTTSSISFVKETLFPYVREHLKEYVEKNWDVEEFKADLEKLKEQAQKDENDKAEGFVAIKGSTPEEERESLIKNVLWQMDGDRKTGALKQLQGHIWREAYNSGSIKGHVYEDVPKAFEEWTNAERKIFVYSSGSVEAQKLLFAHTEHGDMTKYFTDYFDTEVGPKQQSSSYKNILAKINAEPSSVMFLTDVAKEAAAAKEAGISVKLVVRPGNAPLTDEEKVIFTTIDSFLDLSFQTSAKRKRVEKSEEKEAPKEKSSAPEAMDTSENSVTSVPEKCAEKSEASETNLETAKIEKTEIPAKSDQVSMDVDNKDETEKKNAEIVDKPPETTEKTDKQEEESKTNDETKEAVSTQKDARTSEVETTTSKDSATAQSEAAKEVAEPIKETSQAATKDAREEPVVAAEPSTETRSEPMDEQQIHSLPSKNDATLSTKVTEEKTEAPEKSAEASKAEKTVETEASVSIESSTTKAPAAAAAAAPPAVPESKKENETDLKSSSANKDTSVEAVPETSLEKKEEKNERETNSEKTEQQAVPASKTVEPVVEPVGQDKEEAKKEEVKQNGESNEEAKSTESKEKNGDLKEEKEIAVAAVAPVETAKEEASPVEKQQEKPEEKLEADKKEKETVETKTGEVAEGKLNGSLETTETAEKTEAHRNGLNGDSLSEKSNGESQKETATSSSSQNGQTETLPAESIKSKKVVDSTIAEGATAEPDVVPPVPVAATS